MNAIPPEPFRPQGAPHSLQSDTALADKWAALAKAASAIAMLAGQDTLAEAGEHLAIPEHLMQTAPRRALLIEQAIDDLVAVMTPGLRALLEVHARGSEASAPAQALWQEFVTARAGLIALADAPAKD